MKKFMAIWQMFTALMAVMESEKFKDTMDNIFDLLEDNFPEVQAVQGACASGRLLFQVPDDDD